MSNGNGPCPCCIFLKQDLFLPSPSTTEQWQVAACPQDDVVSPPDALRCILKRAKELSREGETKSAMLLVDTHNHAHLKRERHEAYRLSDGDRHLIHVVSSTLSVEPADWDDALRYSATESPDLTLMGLGIHPWYLSDDMEPGGPWKEQLETLLQQHPSAIVGEIGLCKMAKCARTHPEGKTRGFEIQRAVLEDQLELAVRYRRPVSIHCVQQHGVFLDIVKAISTRVKAAASAVPSNFAPPAMAMHSFTGTAHHVKQLLQWEDALFGEGPNDRKKKQSTVSTDQVASPRSPLIYFGFSHIVNYEMCTSAKARKQGREAVRAVPLNRLLAESDVHHPLDVPAGMAGSIAYISWAIEQPIPQVAELTAKNGLAFLQSHLATDD